MKNGIKRAVYLFATTVLGVMLSFLVHAFIEISYLHWALSRELVPTFYGSCALPPVLQITLWVLGAVGGFLMGRFWWRKIYVERVWAKNCK